MRAPTSYALFPRFGMLLSVPGAEESANKADTGHHLPAGGTPAKVVANPFRHIWGKVIQDEPAQLPVRQVPSGGLCRKSSRIWFLSVVHI
jgi:hypothetical protein